MSRRLATSSPVTALPFLPLSVFSDSYSFHVLQLVSVGSRCEGARCGGVEDHEVDRRAEMVEGGTEPLVVELRRKKGGRSSLWQCCVYLWKQLMGCDRTDLLLLRFGDTTIGMGLNKFPPRQDCAIVSFKRGAQVRWSWVVWLLCCCCGLTAVFVWSLRCSVFSSSPICCRRHGPV